MRLPAVVVIAVSTAAWADGVPTEAQALFDQGIKDMQAGKLDVACKELAAALSKYPDMGIKGALATCYTKANKTASAWTLWRELADRETDTARKASATKHASELEPKLPRFAIRLAGTVPGLVVTINGTTIADPTLSVPIPVDPGPIAASAQAPGYVTWTATLTATEAQTTTIDIPQLVTGGGARVGGDAQGLAAQGRAEMAQARYMEAIRELTASYMIAADPEVMFSIAEAYRLEGDRRNAADAYQRYLVAAATGPNAASAHAHLDEMSAQAPRPAPSADRNGVTGDLHLALGEFVGSGGSAFSISLHGAAGSYVSHSESTALALVVVGAVSHVTNGATFVIGGGILGRSMHSATFVRGGLGLVRIGPDDTFSGGVNGEGVFVDGLYQLGKSGSLGYGVTGDFRFEHISFESAGIPAQDSNTVELLVGFGAVFR